MLRKLTKQFIAVLVGNLVYFFALMPHLPLAGQHRPDRLDLGLLVDFWVCVAFYGVIEMLDRRLRRDKAPPADRKI
ncbi:MAG: hypothetical protein P4M04_02155 [Acidobacteriota bacterium]|nr:hypothetical protein [Acidobacteriota bacterium]